MRKKTPLAGRGPSPRGGVASTSRRRRNSVLREFTWLLISTVRIVLAAAASTQPHKWGYTITLLL